MKQSHLRATWLLILSLLPATFAYNKSVTLTPQNNNEDGAEVNLLTDTTNSGYSWDISCSDARQFWAIEISLDPSWGFHGYLPSFITLRVNSNTQFTTNAGFWSIEPIFSFSVNRAKYWSTMLTSSFGWMGPQCDVHTPPQSSSQLYAGDIKELVDQSSEPREETCGLVDDWQHDNLFPLEFKIETVPSDNVMYVYNVQPTLSLKCGFADMFATEQGLQIYLHLSDVGQVLSVESFGIEYYHEDEQTTTANPTTANPTTANPTTARPSTGNPSTANPTTNGPTTADPTTSKPPHEPIATTPLPTVSSIFLPSTSTLATVTAETIAATTTATLTAPTLTTTTESASASATSTEAQAENTNNNEGEVYSDQDADTTTDAPESESAGEPATFASLVSDLGAVGTAILAGLLVLILGMCVAIVCVICRIRKRRADYRARVQAASPKSSQMMPMKGARSQLIVAMKLDEDDEKQMEHVTAGGPNDGDSGEDAKTDDDDLLQGMETHGGALPAGENSRTTDDQQTQLQDRVELAIAGGDNDSDDDAMVLNGMNATVTTMGEF